MFKSNSCVASRRSLSVSMKWLRNETRARRFSILKTYFELYSKFRTHTVQLYSKFGKKKSITPLALTVFTNGFMTPEKGGAFSAYGHFQDTHDNLISSFVKFPRSPFYIPWNVAIHHSAVHIFSLKRGSLHYYCSCWSK